MALTVSSAHAGDLEALEAKAVLRPDDANIQFNVGVLAYQQGQLAKAEGALERAAKLKPKDAETLELLGKVYQDEGKWQASLPVLKSCLEADGTRLDAMVSLGTGLDRVGQTSEALVWLEKAAGKAPKDPDIQADLGLLWIKRSNLANARTAFEACRKLDPANTTALANLCQLYNQTGQADLAQNACTDALAHPSDRPANAHYNLGFALQKLKKPAQAEKEFDQALQLDPTLASAHYNLGLLRYQGSQLEAAASHFRAALKSRRGAYPEARYNLAVVLGDMGQWPEAAGQYRELLAKDPADEDARANLAFVVDKGVQEYLGLGTAAFLGGHADEAATAWKKALALDPANADAKTFLARAQEKMALGRAKPSGRSTEKADKEDAALLVRASASLEAGRAPEAAKQLAFYVRNHPKDLGARRKLSLARSKVLAQVQDLLDQAASAKAAGDPDKTKASAQQALALDPGNVRAQTYLKRADASGQPASSAATLQAAYYDGMKLYLKGDLDHARSAWKAVLAADPGHLDAKRSLEQVDAEQAAMHALKKAPLEVAHGQD